MKKVLLFITAILFGFGAFAQTVSMPWNQYGSGSPIIAYQGKDASKVATYTPVVGDVVTVTIAGTADQNISAFQIALVDDAPPSYWTELAGFKTLGPVTAGVPFSFTVDLAVIATGSPKLVFDGTNATLAGADGTGTSISLTLTTYTVSIFSPILGATVLTDNGNGAEQGTFTKLGTTPVVVGDVVHVNLQGVSDVDATEFQVVIVDESPDASTPYWTELSAYTDFVPADITAGPTFNISADVTITSAPIGTAVKFQNIVLMAKSTGTIIQLSLTSFTADVLTATVDKTALNAAITAAQAKYTSAVEGTAVGNYAVGSKATLNTAILAASAVSANASATVGDVSSALTALNSAVATFDAGIVTSGGTVVATVSMPWNQYGSGSPVIAYQGKDASKVATYTPAAGDVVTVTIAGTSDQNIAAFQIALVDDAAPSYWTELAGFKALGAVTAGVPFSFTVDLAVTATGAPKLVFDGTNATLAGADGTGTSIELDLTTYDVSIFTPISGATVLTDNGNGAKQGTFTKLGTNPVVVGDVIRVNLQGISDVDATEFQVIVVDESADASTPYWTELSAYTDFTPADVTAGQIFDLSADITITSAPVGTDVKFQNIVLLAKTTSGIIQLSLSSFTADVLTSTVDKTALNAAITAAQAKYNTSVEGTAVGQYAVGSRATLNTAILAASAVSVNASATTGDVSSALTTLNSAVATFDAGIVGAVAVTGVTLSQSTLSLSTTSAPVTLTATVLPVNATNIAVSWTTSNSLVATVSSAGIVTVVGAGTANITVTTVDGAKTAICVVTVISVVVDKTALNAAITAAQAKYNSAVEGTAVGNYAVGSKATLNTAILSASAVSANASATAGQVSSALTALNSAVATFDATIVTSTIVGTVSMPWNQYGSGTPIIAYQGKDASKVSSYTPAVGDVVTVTIAGTSNQNIADFQVALVDDAPPAYWLELATFQTLGAVTAGVPFSFTVDLTVIATGSPKLVFDGTNATLAGANGTGTSISLALTTYDVTIVTAPVDKTALNLAITAALASYASAVEGTAVGQYAFGSKIALNTAITAAQAIAADGTVDATEVAAALASLNTSITAFEAEVITSIDGIESSSISVVVVNGFVTVNAAVSSISIASVSGSIVSNSANVSSLANGTYIAIVTLADGSVVSQAFVK